MSQLTVGSIEFRFEKFDVKHFVLFVFFVINDLNFDETSEKKRLKINFEL